MKWLVFLTLLTFSAFASADITTAESSKYSAELVYTILKLAKLFGYLVGFMLFITALVSVCKLYAENSKTSQISIVLMVLTGTLMMNSDSALSVLGNTYFDKSGVEDVCYIVQESGVSETCFSDELSGLTGQLKDRIEKMSGGKTAEIFFSKLKVILGLLQTIGFIYFLVGTYGLYQVSNGSSKDGGFGKPLTTMFASALIVDLPHTMENAVATLNKVGIQF